MQKSSVLWVIVEYRDIFLQCSKVVFPTNTAPLFTVDQFFNTFWNEIMQFGTAILHYAKTLPRYNKALSKTISERSFWNEMVNFSFPFYQLKLSYVDSTNIPISGNDSSRSFDDARNYYNEMLNRLFLKVVVRHYFPFQ